MAGQVALAGAALRCYANARHTDELSDEVGRLNGLVDEMGRVKEEFLATLSHELRTPLNAMLGWLQLLRLHIEDPVERAHALDVLERNAHAQLHIVADLLDVSRIVTGKMQLSFERVDVAGIVEHACEVLRPMATTKQVLLRTKTEPIRGIVYGDRNRLQQVIWNLVNNAIKFTPPHGTVTAAVRMTARHVEIAVTDTGIGIAPEVLPYIFDRFRQGDSSLTRAYGGLGLGLAIVRHLVELHGGSVTASSRGIDTGATFTVTLPYRSAPAESAWEEATSQAVGRQA